MKRKNRITPRSVPQPGVPPKRNSLHLALIAAFLAILVTPSLGLYLFGFTYDPTDAPEAGAQILPLTGESFRDGSYLRNLKLYFAQRFFLRRQMIRLVSRLGLRFGISTTPDVILGSDGWLFLGDDAERRCLSRRFPYSDAELTEWREYLEDIQVKLAARGIKFLFLVAPDKHSVYSERVPGYLKGSSERVARMDQLLDHLQSHSTVSVADLRAALKQAKPASQLYSKRDTHWNSYGAYAGYSVVSAWIGRQFGTARAVSLSDLAVHSKTRTSDLGRMLGVSDYLSEDGPDLQPKTPTGCDLTDLETKNTQVDGARFTSRCPATRPPRRILMFCDSFASAMAPFLAREAAEATFMMRTHPDLEAIEREKPDLVIYELVERHLMRSPDWLKRRQSVPQIVGVNRQNVRNKMH